MGGTVMDNEVQMLKQRIKNLEIALQGSTDLLEDMINDPSVGGLYRLLSDAEELIGENRAVLEGEFEE
jgi:hypothetical protein